MSGTRRPCVSCGIPCYGAHCRDCAGTVSARKTTGTLTQARRPHLITGAGVQDRPLVTIDEAAAVRRIVESRCTPDEAPRLLAMILGGAA